MDNKELHRVVPTAIIVKDGKYLILKRSLAKKAFPGKWSVPGGGISVDDYINEPKTTNDHWYYAIENALKREVREETGLEIDGIRYLLDLIFIRSDGIPIVVMSYYCKWKFGEVKLDEDSTDYAWVTLAELKNYDLVEGLYGEIEMVDKILTQRKSA